MSPLSPRYVALPAAAARHHSSDSPKRAKGPANRNAEKRRYRWEQVHGPGEHLGDQPVRLTPLLYAWTTRKVLRSAGPPTRIPENRIAAPPPITGSLYFGPFSSTASAAFAR